MRLRTLLNKHRHSPLLCISGKGFVELSLAQFLLGIVFGIIFTFFIPSQLQCSFVTLFLVFLFKNISFHFLLFFFQRCDTNGEKRKGISRAYTATVFHFSISLIGNFNCFLGDGTATKRAVECARMPRFLGKGHTYQNTSAYSVLLTLKLY